jgi:acetylglutamate kinase
MKILVKLGGTLLDEPASRASLAAQLAAFGETNPITAVVHGGGKQMTRYLDERGIRSEFVEGLRVSSPEVIDAVLKIFAGTVNHELVAALVAAGSPAVGLSGIDAGLSVCEILNPALGAVGRPVESHTRLLDTLCTGGFLPVIACVGASRQGQILNVNADQMATSLAAAWQVDRLLFLTDVNGVRGAVGESIPVLRAAEAQQLMDDGIATGGMMAKLRSALFALENGVREVRIALGTEPNVIARIQSGEALGTALVS